MARIPGQKAKHAIITDTCRENRGNSGALNEAVARMEDEYDELVRNFADVEGVKFHLVLTVERPGKGMDPCD